MHALEVPARRAGHHQRRVRAATGTGNDDNLLLLIDQTSVARHQQDLDANLDPLAKGPQKGGYPLCGTWAKELFLAKEHRPKVDVVSLLAGTLDELGRESLSRAKAILVGDDDQADVLPRVAVHGKACGAVSLFCGFLRWQLRAPLGGFVGFVPGFVESYQLAQ